MNTLEERDTICPCCGESITLLVDCSLGEQSYVEDCQVCCQPLVVDVMVAADDVWVQARPENG